MVDIISFVGILLALLLITFGSQKNKSKAYLAGFYFLISLTSLSTNSIFLLKNSVIFQYLNPYSYPLYYCSGPFLYLYIKKSLAEEKDRSLKLQEYLYFLPVILVSINFSPQFFLSEADKETFFNGIILNPLSLFNMKYLFFSLKINTIFRPVYNLVFVVAGFLIIFKKSNDIELFNSKNIYLKFIQTLLFLYFIYNLMFIVLIAFPINFVNVTDYAKVDSTSKTLIWAIGIINLSMYALKFLYAKSIYGLLNLDQTILRDKSINLINLNFEGGEKVEQCNTPHY